MVVRKGVGCGEKGIVGVGCGGALLLFGLCTFLSLW